jgi:hypothetical protein
MARMKAVTQARAKRPLEVFDPEHQLLHRDNAQIVIDEDRCHRRR